MNRRSVLAAAALLAIVTNAHPAIANDRAVVQSFYSEILNASTKADLPDRVARVLAPGWTTHGGFGPPGDAAQFTKVVQFFGHIIPNLKWEIVEILNDGNRYIVRGKVTGTPSKPFFGTQPTGKSFEIQSIDIHTVEGGKLTRVYRVEDWAGALTQLKAR